MAKITAKDIYEIESRVWKDGATFEESAEDTQNDYQDFAKLINDFLVYGHIPKKD